VVKQVVSFPYPYPEDTGPENITVERTQYHVERTLLFDSCTNVEGYTDEGGLLIRRLSGGRIVAEVTFGYSQVLSGVSRFGTRLELSASTYQKHEEDCPVEISEHLTADINGSTLDGAFETRFQNCRGQECRQRLKIRGRTQ